MAKRTTIAEDEYCTVAEAARLLKVNPSTIWRWIADRKLPAFRVGARRIRLKRQDVAALIQPRGKEVGMDRAEIVAPPTPAEIARRGAVVDRILANRAERVISPMTTAELVRRARAEEMGDHGDGG